MTFARSFLKSSWKWLVMKPSEPRLKAMTCARVIVCVCVCVLALGSLDPSYRRHVVLEDVARMQQHSVPSQAHNEVDMLGQAARRDSWGGGARYERMWVLSCFHDQVSSFHITPCSANLLRLVLQLP